MITDAVGCDSARRALSAGNVINALVYVVICLFRQPKTFNRICFFIEHLCMSFQSNGVKRTTSNYFLMTHVWACLWGNPASYAQIEFHFVLQVLKTYFFVFFYYFFKFYSAFNFFCKLVIISIFFMFLPNLLDEMVQEYLISVTFYIQSKCIYSLCLIIASKHKNRR